MRARRSMLYMAHRFSTETSPVASPLQSIRPLANNAARSWKLRTARDSESVSRSKRANGDGGATGCGTGTGTSARAAGGGAGGAGAAGGAAGGGTATAGAVVVGRRRGAGGGGGFRVVRRDTICLARSSSPAHGGGTPGLRSAKYQYPPAPAPASSRRIAARRSHGPRRLKRRGLGAGLFFSSSSSSRNVGDDIRRGGAATGGGGGGTARTDSGVTVHGISSVFG